MQRSANKNSVPHLRRAGFTVLGIILYREFMAANKKTQRSSIQRVIDARNEKAFFELARRFRASNDPERVKQLGDELGCFVFGQIATGTKV